MTSSVFQSNENKEGDTSSEIKTFSFDDFALDPQKIANRPVRESMKKVKETMEQHIIPPELLREICKLNAKLTYKDAADRKTAVVGPEKGQYKTLDQAIKHVDEFTTIYISEGVYQIKVPITKRGLIFEKKDVDKQVFIVGCEGPTINIEL